jgi:hypothetical protein
MSDEIGARLEGLANELRSLRGDVEALRGTAALEARLGALEGRLSGPKPKPPSMTKDEFLAQVETEGSCWEWKGDPRGPPHFGGFEDPAKMAYHIWQGEPVPSRHVLRRKCHETCVNPEHMLDPIALKDMEHDALRRMHWEGEVYRNKDEEWRAWARERPASPVPILLMSSRSGLLR